MYQPDPADSPDPCPADIFLVERGHAFAEGWVERLEELGYPARCISAENDLAAGDLALFAVGDRADLDAAARLVDNGTAVVLLFDHYDPSLFNRARALKPLGYLFPPYDEGSVAGVLQTAFDCLSLECSRRRAETRLDDAQGLAHIGYWEWDLTNSRVEASDEACRILGLEVGTIHSFEALMQCIWDEERVEVETLLRTAIEERKNHTFEHHIQRPNGSLRLLEVQIKPVCDAKGICDRVFGTLRDVSERRGLQKHLNEHSELLQTILEHLPVMVAYLDPEGRIRLLNRFAERRLGLTTGEACEIDFIEACFPEPDSRREICSFMESGEGWRDLRLTSRDGTAVESAWTNVRLSDGSRIAIGIDIGERKERERGVRRLNAELRKSIRELRLAEAEAVSRAQDFRSLAENSPDIITRFDRRYRHLYVNRTVEHVTGIGREEFIGKTNREMGMPEDKVRSWNEALDSVFSSGEQQKQEFSYTGPSGDTVWYEWCLVPEIDPAGRVQTVLTIARDISVRKRSEERIKKLNHELQVTIEELQNSERLLQRSEAMAALGYWEMDLDTGAERWSPQLYRIFGRPKDGKLSYGIFLDHIHPDDRSRVETKLSDAVAGKEACDLEFRIVRSVGDERILRLQGELGRGTSGSRGRFFGTAQDITERKCMEEELRESEHRFRQLAENIDEVFWLTEWPQNRLLYVSSAFEQVWGESADALYADPTLWSQSIVDEDRQRVMEAFTNDVEQSDVDMEFRIRRPDGEVRWIHDRAFGIRNDGGELVRVAGLASDISIRKSAEEALRRSEERFRLIADNIGDVFWMSTPGIGEMVYVNPAYERIWGRSRADLYRHPHSFIDAIHPEDRERVAAGIGGHAEGRWSFDYRIVRPDGTTRWIQDRGFPIRDGKGDLLMLTGLATDITEMKEAEQQLQSTIGQLARAKEEMERANHMLERMALQDPLTGVANRRFLEGFIGREWRRERRHKHEVSLIMVDIDNFKSYNDHYGHPQGDGCLKRVAEALAQQMRRPTDVLVRFGGEEFAIVLPETDREGAIQIAEKLRQVIADLELPHEESGEPVVTISLGVATVNAWSSNFGELLIRADKALYRAKAAGRNRVMVDSH